MTRYLYQSARHCEGSVSRVHAFSAVVLTIAHLRGDRAPSA